MVPQCVGEQMQRTSMILRKQSWIRPAQQLTIGKCNTKSVLSFGQYC